MPCKMSSYKVDILWVHEARLRCSKPVVGTPHNRLRPRARARPHARTHARTTTTCFTPLRTSNVYSEIGDDTRRGADDFFSKLNNHRLLKRSNAFVRSMNAINSGLLCSPHFNCRKENIVSIRRLVNLAVLKPH